MCSRNEASELLTHLSAGSQSLLGNSARVGTDSPGSPPALATAETITHSFNYLHREVFLSFQYSCPNGILRAIFVEPKRKKNVFNYLFPKVLTLPDCFPLSLSLLLLHWALAGWCLSPQTLYFSRLPNR